jgi:hypothetical protein
LDAKFASLIYQSEKTIMLQGQRERKWSLKIRSGCRVRERGERKEEKESDLLKNDQVAESERERENTIRLQSQREREKYDQVEVSEKKKEKREKKEKRDQKKVIFKN